MRLNSLYICFLRSDIICSLDLLAFIEAYSTCSGGASGGRSKIFYNLSSRALVYLYYSYLNSFISLIFFFWSSSSGSVSILKFFCILLNCRFLSMFLINYSLLFWALTSLVFYTLSLSLPTNLRTSASLPLPKSIMARLLSESLF